MVKISFSTFQPWVPICYIYFLFVQTFDQHLSRLYIYRFSRFDMFVHYFVNYFMRLRTNHYTLLTISLILFIFNSVRNLPYRPLWCFVKVQSLVRKAKCEMRKIIGKMVYEMPSIHFSFLSFRQHFSHSRQFDDKCKAGFRDLWKERPYHLRLLFRKILKKN